MHKFKKEITIIVEGESFSELISEQEIFNNLSIFHKKWWINNDSWPYGEPCEEMKRLEVKSITLKNS